jgi:hypothetical protein
LDYFPILSSVKAAVYRTEKMTHDYAYQMMVFIRM